jgi:hypothetical protein
MGQTLSTIIGYIIVACLKLSDKTKSLFSSTDKKEKNYYNNDILLKEDDEQRAGTLVL